MKLKEKEIQSFILEYLEWNKIGYFWRNNTGGMIKSYKGKNMFMRFGELGSADIIGVLNGRFIAIECKGEGIDKISDNQKMFRDKVMLNGGIYYTANDTNKFQDWINKLKKK